METPKERKLKFFIAYETTTGKDVAEHLKKFLEKCIEVKEAFVAYNDIPLGQENEKEYRYKKIKEADYFILVLTSNAWEISEMLREETALAKKAGKKNFILIAQMRGANIPEELKLIQRLSTHPFETKEEIARKLGGIINDLYKTRLQERAPHEELNLVGESEFVKNIEEIINKNKRIYFYSPLPPINCLNEGYMNKITRLLDGAMEKDKNIFFLFCLNPTVEKMRNMLTSSNPNKELLKDKLLNDIEILLEKPYLKLIIPFDTILQTPSKDEGIVFGENSKDGAIWWKPASKDKIYIQNVNNSKTIPELFNRNYNDNLSPREAISKFLEIFKLF